MNREELYKAIDEFNSKADKDDFLFFMANDSEGESLINLMKCTFGSLHDNLMTFALQNIDIMDIILSIASIIEENGFDMAETDEELKELVNEACEKAIAKNKIDPKFVN